MHHRCWVELRKRLAYLTAVRRGNIGWALELSPPEAEHRFDPWDEPDTRYLDFFVRNIAQNLRRKARRFRVYVLGESTETQAFSIKALTKIQEILLDEQDLDVEDGPMQSFSLLDESTEGVHSSRPFRKMLTGGVHSGPNGQSFDVERAELAYGLACWFILLWDTPWLLNLCSCGIRCLRLKNASTRHAFTSHVDKPH